MAIELLAARYISPQLGSFIRAASAFDEQKLVEVPPNRAIAITIDIVAPPKLRQFYWGLVSKLVEAGIYEGRDAAHVALMVRTGRVARLRITETTQEWIPISTKEWGLVEWRQFMETLMPILTMEIIPGIRFADLRSEVERYVGVRLTDAMKEGT